MLLSMTGFGGSTVQYKDKVFNISIKSLNSKFSDINVKLPAHFKDKELDIRRLALQELVRGKIEVKILSENNAQEEQLKVFNEEIILNYYNQLKQISSKNSIPISENIMMSLIRLPDVIKNNEDELSEEEWQVVLKAFKEAIEDCKSFRKSEGKSIQNDIVQNINSISNLLEQVPNYEKERVAVVKDRLTNSLNEISERIDIDRNRFEQEVIYYLEKFDINEEKVRLKKHCEYFLEILNSDDYAGKKLNFISQEIGREINTLGSKANHVEIQKLVVVMKDELEKIKEQLLNVL